LIEIVCDSVVISKKKKEKGQKNEGLEFSLSSLFSYFSPD